jgi:hypothetical protein
MTLTNIDDERSFRFRLLAQAEMTRDLMRVPTSVVNDLRIFYGGRGIWYDAKRTSPLANPGVTVGILHTGQHYDDQLDPSGIIFNYPSTQIPGKDNAEIDATKNCGRFGLPVFVVVGDGQTRAVHLGWVEDWDDNTGSFLVTFGERPSQVAVQPVEVDAPFVMIESKPKKKGATALRPGQQKFSFEVKKRSGSACAFCGLDVKGLVDAAHIVPKENGGSDDPRNGIPLCPTHHRAFDLTLVCISGEGLELQPGAKPTLERLGVTRSSLKHLPGLPHPDVIAWRAEYMRPD